jgi:hypothetical protein
MDGMMISLPRHWVFQFDRCKRQTIDTQNQIGNAPRFNFDLTGEGKAILGIEGEGVGIHARIGLEVGKLKGFTVAFKPIPQYVDRASAIDHLDISFRSH